MADRLEAVGEAEGVLTVSLELWLFAAVMEVIVIGTFFGGTYLAYRVGRKQSAPVAGAGQAPITAATRQAGVSGTPTEREERTAPAA